MNNPLLERYSHTIERDARYRLALGSYAVVKAQEHGITDPNHHVKIAQAIQYTPGAAQALQDVIIREKEFVPELPQEYPDAEGSDFNGSGL